jgi:alanyl-tRNA synthetase
LRELALGVRDRLAGSSVVVVGSAAGSKGALVAVVSKDLIAKGISAADLIGDAARELGGGGSRDPELAQAGGPNGSQLGVALDKARTEASRALAAL